MEAKNLLLSKDSEVVPLTPKAVEVLRALIEANGKLLTKAEISDRVRAETFVEEANLAQHISALRKALGEDKNGKKFIETIPRRGYRFVVPVSELSNAAAEIVVSEKVTERFLEAVEVEEEEATEDAKKIGALERNLTLPAASCEVMTFEQFPGFTLIRRTPDGKAIVFRREANSVGNLWQQNLDGGAARQITDFTSDTIYNFVYSADGSRLFLSRGFYQTNAVLMRNF